MGLEILFSVFLELIKDGQSQAVEEILRTPGLEPGVLILR